MPRRRDALEDQRVKREDAEDAAQKMEAMLREAESRPVEVAIDETAVQRAVEEAKAAAAEEKKKAVAELEKKLKAAESAARDAGKSAGAAAEKARPRPRSCGSGWRPRRAGQTR